MKVVIIDDDKLVSMSLKMILENGTDIEVAAVGEDGREAVSLYKKYSPDILLLDIRLAEQPLMIMRHRESHRKNTK